ncbi:MAG: hypothetical protein AAFP86_00075 [Planctomycetota bacterium]
MLSSPIVPVAPQTVQPGPDLVFDDVQYGTEAAGAGGLTGLRDDAREDTGIVGEALFPRFGTTAAVLALALVYFGFVRPRLRGRRG